ncbi:MAG: hypothetical protein MRK02_04965 [Candidatus Scalindua sp.]|nr:hypothetical protein [Candidatus Scalindua sp.]
MQKVVSTTTDLNCSQQYLLLSQTPETQKTIHTPFTLFFNILKFLQIIFTHLLIFILQKGAENVSFLEDHTKPAGRFIIEFLRGDLKQRDSVDIIVGGQKEKCP